MKTILIYTSPARGHLYPMMDVAIKLRKRGHNVLVQTLSSEKEHVEKEDITHLSISSEIESLELQDYNESNPISQFKSAFRSWLARAPYEIEDLQESCNKFNPDLLIVDVNTWGAGAYAESEKEIHG
ncbi:MAG: glycosyltransferase [Balneolaceae bacterium]|nr:glycosyltransferase [Balneolaceae bacterium]